MSNAPPSSIEARLASLEHSLGMASLSGPSSDTGTATSDMKSRIDRIVADMASKTKGTGSGSGKAAPTDNLDADWGEIDSLLTNLDAGTLLSHQGVAGLSGGMTSAQQPLTAPLLYRRQEVLASADALSGGMERLSQIRDLLSATTASSGRVSSGVQASATSRGSAGRKAATAGGAGKGGGDGTGDDQANADKFANAPLLTSERYNFPTAVEAQRRLHDVSIKAADVNTRAVDVATRVDNLVFQYHKIMAIASEKFVLADEELCMAERSR